MNLLVTGGCGFIGSNFVRRQRQQHPEDRVVVLDALTYAGNLHNLDDLEGDAGMHFICGDVCDGDLLRAVLADHAIDAIIHFAAESHVDRSIHGPAAFVTTNVLGTATLLEAARARRVERYVQVSTDEVYGDLGPGDAPFCETTPMAPRSPYAASKAAADLLVLSYAHTYTFPAIITRCSNNYGPYQFPEKLIPLMIINALADRPLPVYGDGSNVRDWIHVSDHCDGLDRVLRAGREGEVYNLGGRCERRNIDIVRAILALLNKPWSLIRFVADRPGHDRRYAIDCRRVEEELGFAPRYTLDQGLGETVAWYRDRRDWWEPILSGQYRSWYQRNYEARLKEAGVPSQERAPCG